MLPFLFSSLINHITLKLFGSRDVLKNNKDNKS